MEHSKYCMLTSLGIIPLPPGNFPFLESRSPNCGYTMFCNPTPGRFLHYLFFRCVVAAQIGPTESDSSCGGSEMSAGEEPMFARLEVGLSKWFALGRIDVCNECHGKLKGLWHAAHPRALPAPGVIFRTKGMSDKLQSIARQPMLSGLPAGKRSLLSKGCLAVLLLFLVYQYFTRAARCPRRYNQVLYLGFNRITDISALCLERMPYLLAVDLQVPCLQ